MSQSNTAYINAYGCTTTAGAGVDALWQALKTADFPIPAKREFRFQNYQESKTTRELLVRQLTTAFIEACPKVPSGTLGILLASTKGYSNDFIWDLPENQQGPDPLSGILEDFIATTGLKPKKSLCVSNACSSALAAMKLAQMWLDRGEVDQVMVLAADAVTPFVRKGFQSLKLETEDRPRPFAENRSGFFLGEAAACLLLSQNGEGPRLLPVGLDTEGSAVTRPSFSGESLIRAVGRIPDGLIPDIIVAHGTGTLINDETEDLAFGRLYPNARPWITGSKWRTGHTLGASAAIDTILACEILRRGTTFALATTDKIDPKFSCRFITRRDRIEGARRVMVSSLGFGGMHAAALLEHPACV